MHCSQTMSKSQTRLFSLLAATLVGALLAACTTVKAPPASPACPACPACVPCPAAVPTAPPAKPMQVARFADLPGWADDDLTAAWPAFLQSCRALASKPKWLLWRAACAEAKGVSANDGGAQRRFFEARFEPYLLTNPDGTTSGLITGYYEPLLHGSRRRTAPSASWA